MCIYLHRPQQQPRHQLKPAIRDDATTRPSLPIEPSRPRHEGSHRSVLTRTEEQPEKRVRSMSHQRTTRVFSAVAINETTPRPRARSPTY